MTTPIATRASTSKPCPVCGSGSKGCNITTDGLHFCRGEPQQGWKRLTKDPDNAGFHHYRSEEDDRNLHRDNGQPDARPPTDWNAKTAQYAKALTPERKQALARALDLPTEALDVVYGIGWREDDLEGPCWTLPERDAAGKVLGLTRRYPDNSKKNLGNRGLCVPRTWSTNTGPVFVVEGASDTIALSHCGLAAVGRPSNTSGQILLIDLFRELSPTREIIVVGENDRKIDGKWPGRDGAVKVAHDLAIALKRPVKWALPPADYKDARAWILDAAAGSADVVDWPSIGADVRTTLAAAARCGPAESRFKFIDSKDFLTADYRPRWLVPFVLVKHQPGLIAGPSKGMKTSIMVDLAISIASARPFLGKWDVHERKRVAVVSGESGAHTLQETCLRILKAKDIPPHELHGWLKWEFKLPIFSDLESIFDFAEQLKGLGAEVIFIDPFYLALGEIDARNLFEMGRALNTVADLLIPNGITPVLAHHANRLLPVGEPMELQHVAYAGVDQFTRQVILLNRKEPYRNDGIHDLWFRIGGSAGHGSLSHLHIEEGLTDENFSSRYWNVDVRPFTEALLDDKVKRDAAKREERLRSIQHDQDQVMLAIEAEVKSGRLGATESRIRERTAFSRDRARNALERLLEAGAIIRDEWNQPGGKNATQLVKGFRPAPPETEPADLFAQ